MVFRLVRMVSKTVPMVSDLVLMVFKTVHTVSEWFPWFRNRFIWFYVFFCKSKALKNQRNRCFIYSNSFKFLRCQNPSWNSEFGNQIPPKFPPAYRPAEKPWEPKTIGTDPNRLKTIGTFSHGSYGFHRN